MFQRLTTLLIFLGTLAACNEHDKQWRIVPWDSSVHFSTVTSWDLPVEDVMKVQTWEPVTLSDGIPMKPSEKSALWVKIPVDHFQDHEDFIFFKHCPYATDLYYNQEKIADFADFNQDYREFYKVKQSLFVSQIPKSTPSSYLYMKQLLHPTLMNSGRCKQMEAGTLPGLITRIFSNEIPELVFGCVAIIVALVLLILNVFYRSSPFFYFGWFCLFYGTSHAIGLEIIWFVSGFQRSWWDIWQLSVVLFPIGFMMFFRDVLPTGKKILNALVSINLCFVVLNVSCLVFDTSLPARKVLDYFFQFLGVVIFTLFILSCIGAVKSKGYNKFIATTAIPLYFLFSTDLLIVLGMIQQPLISYIGVLILILILIGLAVSRNNSRLHRLEKEKMEELELNKNRLEKEVENRTLELAHKAEAVIRSNKELEDSNILLKATNQQLHSANVRSSQVLNRITEIERSNINKLKQLFDHPSIDSDLRKAGLVEINSLEEDLSPITSTYLTAKSIEDKRVLHLSSDKKDINLTKIALGGTLIKLDQTGDPEDCLRRLGQRSYDVLIITPEFCDIAKTCNERFPSTKIILMTTDQFASQIDTLLEREYISNLIFKDNKDPSFNLRNLVTTITTVINRDYFGISKFLAWGANIQDIPVTCSDTRQEIIDQMSEFLKSAGVRKSSVNKAVLICDEMLMNIIYDAPVDEFGKPKYNHLSRTETIKLKPSEQGSLKFGFDGNLIAIAGQDPFGALTRETILKYVQSCYKGRYGSINQELGKGGGGMGIFQILSSSDLVIVNVKDGVKTEFVSLINVISHSKTDRHTTSFQFFKV